MEEHRASSLLEAAVAQVWRDLLAVSDVNPDDDFFELGGDSLRAVEMLAMVDEILLTLVDFPDFLEEPTVAGLAAAVERSRLEPSDTAPEPLRVAPAAADRIPCTFAQERLWFLDQLTGPTGVYNMPLGTRFRGELDSQALARGIREIVRRHGALRTTFGSDADGPFQVVAPDPRIDFTERDLTSEADPEQAAQRLVDEFASLPFDLEVGPLVRALLLHLSESEHVLELVFDHIICDGWSQIVVHDELGELYDAYREDRDPQLPEPSLQYVDYAARQRERQTDVALENVLEYWRERLAGTPDVLEIPTDRPRPPMPSGRGATRRTHLSAESAETIRAFARAEGVTLFVSLLAVFDVLLFRITGQETVTVGTTSASRQRGESQAVGLFASTVALRADLDGEPTFRELLSQVRRTVLEAVAYQDAPFERLVAELRPERDPSRHPIFQVFFAHVPLAALAIEGAEPFDASPPTSRFDLTLWVEEETDGLDLVWEFSTDLFDVATVERLERQYLQLLDAALGDPDRPVTMLPLMGDAERRALLESGGERGHEFQVDCLHELFERRAAAQPDAVAVTYEGACLRYGTLNERANQLAHRLRGLGVGPESLVALCLERSPDLVVAILGVLKAGGAYVPLDPEYPFDRLAFALDDTKARVLVTTEHLLDRLPDDAAAVVCLDRDALALEGESAENPASATTPVNAAYVIYTSGSTGRPKGVVVEHRNVARLFAATDDWFGFEAGDTWTLVHSYAFDFSVWELWGALLYGGRLVVVPQWTTRSPGALRDLLVEERVTVLNATPSLFLSVLDDLLVEAGGLSLRLIVFGGEALHPPTLRAWFERFGAGGPTLVNMYGITETTVHVTYRPITLADCNRDSSPIGEPIPDLQLYVLDAKFEPVPEGVPGELYVGGAGVARGYLNRPELTEERFLPNPHGSGRLYRTGDRARNVGGELEYLGRIDTQVKIRGFRIELGEIQNALTDHPDIRDAIVTTFEGASGDTRLAAYTVPEGSRTVGSDELRRHLEARLPVYMVPSSFVQLEELPLTPNGKLDRAALPPPVAEERSEEAAGSPGTVTEQRIAEIWQEVLGVEAGPADNFFHLGGHSLLAARVTTRTRDEFAIELSVRALFDRPTLGAFAAHVDAARSQASDQGSALAAEASTPGRRATYPLSFQQQQLLFLDQLAPGSAVYNAAFAVRVLGPLDRVALTRAVETLVERHEALRTVLEVDGDSAMQLVLDDWSIEFPLVLLDHLPPEERQPTLEARLREGARRPFDLQRDLLLRPTLFRLDANDHVLLLQTHHVAFDAWAIDIFFTELGEVYRAALENREPRLPSLPASYGDFALWQRARLTGRMLEDEVAFWRTHLSGAPLAPLLAAERPRQAAAELEAASVAFELSQPLADDARALCAAEGVTAYMLLLSAFATLLYRLTGQDDLLVGGPSANRVRSDFDGVIGFFANTVVTRVRLDGNPSFSELLRRVRASTLETMEHQELPFEQVVEAIGPPRLPGVNPLFQVNFRTRTERISAIELHGTETSLLPADVGLARFDVAFEANVHEHGVSVELIYAADLFERPTIERLAAAFERILGQGVAVPSRRLLALELADEQAVVASGPGIPRRGAG